jgi:DNA invertase Pin-like site-specific DNA recombinase
VRSDKITPEHLARKAIVYVRQSKPDQVRHHLEGKRRQYDLADRARELGWQIVDVIDEDLGRTGVTAVGRTGFARLVAAVGLREVGAIFSLEASRLARNNRDWYQLIDLCAFMDTLIIDFDGVYDPRLLNDRLVLGMKGTMAEFEIG